MRYAKTTAKWAAIVVGFLLLMGWAESGGAEPATKWMVLVVLAAMLYHNHLLSKQIQLLSEQITNLHIRLLPPERFDD